MHSLSFGVPFYRAAAVCSFLSAITTLLLIFLPEFYSAAQGFEGRMQRVHDPAYVVRSWAYLIHPFLTLAAALGVAMRMRTVASAAAVIGLLGFVLWAFTEAAQQTLTLFAFDRWRENYLESDEATQQTLHAAVFVYDGVWDAMYVLLLLGFAIGNVCFGVALVRHEGLSRALGIFFFAALALTLSNLLSELKWPSLPAAVATWAYPAIQPLARVLIGVWLWRFADENRSLRATA